ncbi:MAG TPA: hypothetical protein VGM16_06185 [Gammaproteobacteria bacterium]|jgi:outer membrane biosynthesis protein TonB
MRGLIAPLLLAALGLALGCSSAPSHPAGAAPQATLPDCEDTNGYPPCIYRGDTPSDSEGPYEGGGDFYPDYGYPYYPGTGVIIVPEPVPVPVPVPTPRPRPHPKPPKKPTPPPKHHRVPINPCHPQPGRPCP